MRLKKWFLGLLAVAVGLFFFTACHRDKKQKPVEPVTMDTVASQEEDSLRQDIGDTVVVRHPRKEEQTMRLDSAETTNLRIFARKQRTIYSPTLMTGIWHQGTEYKEFMDGGMGRFWDTKEDVGREEAQSFRWTMDSNLLVLEFHLALGGMFCRQYVVTFVDDETLVYRDAFERSYMLDRDEEER